MYGACAAAMLRLNALGRLGHLAPRQRGLAVIGVLAVLFSLWATFGAGSEPVLWGAALLAAGLPVYFLVHRGDAAAASAQGPT
jgi:APA family basic amino acid/polyamine antiporter